ncbi:MAG: hydrolase [Rhodospirillaceae bacterium]|nr:hydrolase [Rhodospirillaceae bacterium]
MKLAAFKYKGEKDLGIIDPTENYISPIGSLVSDLTKQNLPDMITLISNFDNLKDKLRISKKIDIQEIEIKAPISNPPKNIFCIGKNYFAHAQEFTKSGFDATSKRGDNIPDNPIIFTKPQTAIIGPNAPIMNHQELTKQLDYEAELAVIIGVGGAKIHHESALKHVFGYTIINDITARDLQLKHRQWFIGKSLDTSCPMGPWITTSDEIDSGNLSIKCWVNDELRQNANTGDLIFDIPTLIETISAGVTLQPGDIISTGTPAGVGIGFDPPKFLLKGDTIKIEIENLGTLMNYVE